jgi:hypothetical protein
MNQALQWRSTDIGRHRPKFSRYDDLATWTFAPLPYTKHFFSLVLSEYILLVLSFLWIFWDGSVYKLSWLLPGKTQETHEEFQNSRFLVERFEIRTQVRNILFTTIHWSYVPRSTQLTAVIARLTLWFIMNGHGRKRPWLLLRYRLCSPVTAQNLNSYSGKSFLRNYSRRSCDTTQCRRNLPTHFIYLQCWSCLAQFTPCSSALTFLRFGETSISIEDLSGMLSLRMEATKFPEASSTRLIAAGWRTPM